MLQLQHYSCERKWIVYRRSENAVEIWMKIATLSAGAPRHGHAITKQWQSISDENGWGWQLDFWEWENEKVYNNRYFASVQWAVWIGLFERAFDFMLMQSECKHLGVFVGTDLLQHFDLVQRGYPDPFHAATILAADAPNLVEERSEERV